MCFTPLAKLRSFGSSDNTSQELNIAAGLAVDAAGRAYITGQFYHTVTIGDGSTAITLTSMGKNDLFVVSYSATGTVASGSGAVVWLPLIQHDSPTTVDYGREKQGHLRCRSVPAGTNCQGQ